MRPGDLEKLLGGYAAGNLTPEEQRELHRAALGDQRLFDLLADEQGLKELLSEPDTRAELLQTISAAAEDAKPKVVPLRPRRAFWAWSLAAAAALCVMVGIGLMKMVTGQREIAVQQIAQAPEPAPMPPALPRQEDSKKEQPPAFAARRQVSKPADERPAPAPSAPPPGAAPPMAYSVSEREKKLEERSDIAEAPKVVAAESAALGKVEADLQSSRLAGRDDAALAWRLQRRSSGGAFDTISAGRPLNAGDEVRIEVSPAAAGILTARLVEGNEQRVLLNQPVEPGKAYLVPGEGSLPSQAGTRRIVLVLSPQPPGGTAGFRRAAAPAKPPLSAEIRLDFR